MLSPDGGCSSDKSLHEVDNFTAHAMHLGVPWNCLKAVNEGVGTLHTCNDLQRKGLSVAMNSVPHPLGL